MHTTISFKTLEPIPLLQRLSRFVERSYPHLRDKTHYFSLTPTVDAMGELMELLTSHLDWECVDEYWGSDWYSRQTGKSVCGLVLHHILSDEYVAVRADIPPRYDFDNDFDSLSSVMTPSTIIRLKPRQGQPPSSVRTKQGKYLPTVAGEQGNLTFDPAGRFVWVNRPQAHFDHDTQGQSTHWPTRWFPQGCNVFTKQPIQQ